jgi:hypothetical protein
MFYFVYSKIMSYRSRKESVFYTSLIISIFQVFLIYVIGFIVERFSACYFNLNEFEIMILYCSFNVINTYYFYKGRKYVQINVKYGNQNDKQKRIKDGFILLIFFLIMFMYFFLANMRSI